MDQKEKLKQMKYAMNARMFLIAAGLFLIFTAVTSTGQDGLRWFGIAKVVTDYDRDVAEGKITPPPAEEETKETVSEEKTENTAETDAESEEMKSETDAGSAEVKAETEDESGTADTDSSNKEEAAETEAAAETASENTETTDASAAEETAQEIDVPALKRDMATLGISVGDLKFLGIACFVIAVIRIFVGVICVKFSNRVDRSSITLKAVIGLAIAEVLYAAVMFLKKALFPHRRRTSLGSPASSQTRQRESGTGIRRRSSPTFHTAAETRSEEKPPRKSYDEHRYRESAGSLGNIRNTRNLRNTGTIYLRR